MPWFNRIKKGIQTSTEEKKEVPEGIWNKCPSCKKAITTRDLEDNNYVCPEDGYHFRIGSKQYFNILFDDGIFTELDADLKGADPLKFTDKKPYSSRLIEARQSTDMNDALRSATGKMNGIDIVVACMDFAFIGGSMGEAAFSLMQMAKTSAKLALLDRAGVPFISLLTDPTTGGVTASFAMLGDFNVAEPGALIGFAGPRVIKETIGKDLPKGFQSAEFLVEHGFVDFIVNRKEMKEKFTHLLGMLQDEKSKAPKKKKEVA